MHVDRCAQIRDEFHHAGKVVVHAGLRRRWRRRCAPACSASVAGPAVAAAAGEGEARRASEIGRAPRSRPSMKVERPTNPATNRSVRALVEVLLGAHLPHGAVVHDHQPVGHRQGLLLVVRDHDGGRARASSAARGSRREPPGAAWHRGWRAARRAAARPAGRRARAPAPRAAAGRRTAAAAGARPGARAGPAAGPRRRGALVSEASILRISSPKATFCATVRCGKSA